MSYVETLQALVTEKKTEIARLEAELRAACAFLDALEARMEWATTSGSSGNDGANERTAADENEDPVVLVRRMLLRARRPLFIDDIVRGLGRQVSRESREDVRGMLLPWVRRREIFTRPRPATYGLIELDDRL